MGKQPKDSDTPSLPRLETLRVPLGEPIPLKGTSKNSPFPGVVDLESG